MQRLGRDPACCPGRGRPPAVDRRPRRGPDLGFEKRAFSAGLATAFVFFTGMIGLMFTFSLYLQAGNGWASCDLATSAARSKATGEPQMCVIP